MKQHTAEELKTMHVNDIESYYEKLHSMHTKKVI